MRTALYRSLTLGLVLAGFAGFAFAGSSLERTIWEQDGWKQSAAGTFVNRIAVARSECRSKASSDDFRQCVWNHYRSDPDPAGWQVGDSIALGCTNYAGSGYSYASKATAVVMPGGIEFPLIVSDVNDCRRAQMHLPSS